MPDDPTAGAPGATPTVTPPAPGAPLVTPQVGGDPPATPTTPALTLEQALDALQRTRAEAAQHRTELKKLQDAAKAADDAKLSETERLSKRLAELERADADRTRSTQERVVRAEVKAAAAGVGIKPELAARLIDYADIEFDADGEPKNLPALLNKLIKDYPELVPQAGRAPVAQPSGGATNPGRSAASGGLTLDIIKAMPMRERMARMAEIEAWEKAQRQTR